MSNDQIIYFEPKQAEIEYSDGRLEVRIPLSELLTLFKNNNVSNIPKPTNEKYTPIYIVYRTLKGRPDTEIIFGVFMQKKDALDFLDCMSANSNYDYRMATLSARN